MKNKMTTTKALALSLVSLSIGLTAATVHAKPTGAVTCDGTELNADGTLNKQRYLYLKGYGTSHPNEQELKRNVSLDTFFALPRVHFPSNREISMAEGLTQTMIFHAAAAKFGIPGVTPKLVQSNSKVAGYSYHERAALRLAENVQVSLRGANSAVLNCRQYSTDQGEFNKTGSFVSKTAYFTVTNGEIADPSSLMTYSCNLTGSWDDMGPALYTVLKESVSAQVIDTVLFEKEVNDSKTAPGSLERYDAYVKAAIAFQERAAAKAKFFEPAQSMLDWRRNNKMQVSPVNQTILHQNYSTSSKLTDLEALKAKAFAVYSSGGCDATLVCTKQKCQLMSDDEYRSNEAALSVVE